MAKPFSLEIITPTGTVYSGKVTHVRAPGVDGDFGVLADHAPLMAGLKPGRVRLDDTAEHQEFVITGGYFEVHNNRAVVLAEDCMRREDIDLPRAMANRDEALKRLEAAHTLEDQEDARADIAKAQAVIKFAES
jgi:F-type H+-transporting ATPase subunit epsilon